MMYVDQSDFGEENWVMKILVRKFITSLLVRNVIIKTLQPTNFENCQPDQIFVDVHYTDLLVNEFPRCRGFEKKICRHSIVDDNRRRCFLTLLDSQDKITRIFEVYNKIKEKFWTHEEFHMTVNEENWFSQNWKLDPCRPRQSLSQWRDSFFTWSGKIPNTSFQHLP